MTGRDPGGEPSLSHFVNKRSTRSLLVLLARKRHMKQGISFVLYTRGNHDAYLVPPFFFVSFSSLFMPCVLWGEREYITGCRSDVHHERGSLPNAYLTYV